MNDSFFLLFKKIVNSFFWKFKVLNSPTGISEKVVRIGVLPNPSPGIFELNFNQALNSKYSVIDNLGRIVLNGVSNDTRIVLDLKNNPTGIYTARIEWEGGLRTIRLVKM